MVFAVSSLLVVRWLPGGWLVAAGPFFFSSKCRLEIFPKSLCGGSVEKPA
jgi:hypothetical protein